MTVQVWIKNWRTGERGWLDFHTDWELPKPGVPSRKNLIEAARRQLHRALCHEADECFVVDGKRPFDPHRKRTGTKRAI